MGKGIIKVSKCVFVDNLAEPEALEEWHKTLMLPLHYQVLATRSEQDVFSVMVESREIHTLPSGILPEVIPHYVSCHVRGGKQKARLDRIEVSYKEALRAYHDASIGRD